MMGQSQLEKNLTGNKTKLRMINSANNQIQNDNEEEEDIQVFFLIFPKINEQKNEFWNCLMNTHMHVQQNNILYICENRKKKFNPAFQCHHQH